MDFLILDSRTWSLDELPRGRPSVGAVFQDPRSVDKDVPDPDGELMCVVERRAIEDGCGIDDQDVGPATWLQSSAIPQGQPVGNGRRHLPDAFLE